ncbi:MAG: hypothetical protein OK422_01430 [Thaumarchaeota archaeon]|nr:hypothetical protein [Nitrososphaerota archaeon]
MGFRQEYPTQLISSPSTGGPIQEYPVPTANAGPLAIVPGALGSYWFTEFSAGKIGEFFQNNQTLREFPVPEAGAKPTSLTVDRGGNVWFSDQNRSGSIWKLNSSDGKFIQFPLATPNATPVSVVIDQTGDVWFTEITGNKLGELRSPTFVLKEFDVPTSSSGPAGLSLQPGTSTLWFTENYANKIAKFDISTSAFQEFTPIRPIMSPVGIVALASGTIWFAEHGGSSIDVFNPTNGSLIKYPTSTPPVSSGFSVSAPATIALDARGRLWFVEHFSNKVGRLDPSSGQMQEFEIPTQGAYSVLNAVDAEGNFWFTEFSGNKLGMIAHDASTNVMVSTPHTIIPLGAGNQGFTNLTLVNQSPSPVRLTLNASGSYTSTGQLPPAWYTFDSSSFSLSPGMSRAVKLSFTANSSLPAGEYSLAVAATYGNFTTLGYVSFQSTGGSGASFPSLLVVAILAVAVLIGAGYGLMRRRRSGATLVPALVLLFALGFSGFTVITSIVSPVIAKCPGLPPGQAQAADYTITYVFIALLTALAIAYFYIKFLWKRKGDSLDAGAT